MMKRYIKLIYICLMIISASTGAMLSVAQKNAASAAPPAQEATATTEPAGQESNATATSQPTVEIVAESVTATPTDMIGDTIETANPHNVDDNSSCTGSSDGFGFEKADDVDFFSFQVKEGRSYLVEAIVIDRENFDVDPKITVYFSNDINGDQASNDDKSGNDLDAALGFIAGATTEFYVKVENVFQGGSFPAVDRYCLLIRLTNASDQDDSTDDEPEPTRIPVSDDECEKEIDNQDFDSACVISPDTTVKLNFVPKFGDGPDNDFFKLWAREGFYYVCKTENLSANADTNMIVYAANQSPLGGNDNDPAGGFGSTFEFLASGTDWVFILVGPVGAVPYEISDQFTYELTCTSQVGAPTPTPTPVTPVPPTPIPGPPTNLGSTLSSQPEDSQTSSGNGQGNNSSSSIPAATPTTVPFEIAREVNLDGAAEPRQIEIQELPSLTESIAPREMGSISVIVLCSACPGDTASGAVGNMPIVLYDNESQELLSFGYTSQNGVMRSEIPADVGALRVVLPFFNIQEIVNNRDEVRITLSPPGE